MDEALVYWLHKIESSYANCVHKVYFVSSAYFSARNIIVCNLKFVICRNLSLTFKTSNSRMLSNQVQLACSRG